MTSSLHLDLYLKEKNTLLWRLIVVMILLTIMIPLIWFAYLRGKEYDVIIEESLEIIDRAPRKKEYRFVVEEAYAGAVQYRIKADGAWKQLFPGEGGVYAIPEDEVVGNIYLQSPHF
jgi:hypothetical protein